MNSKLKWNTKYKERIEQFEEPAPNSRLITLGDYFRGGNALDLACGLGGNSLFFAQRGYQVQAIDISDVAITYIQELAAKKNLSIDAKLADLTALDHFSWENDSFDVIVITNYLDRMLFPTIKRILKENGYLFMDTYYQSPKAGIKDISTHYKLKPKELLKEFADWQILYYEENEHVGRQTIFCRK
ncbi:methyltransferase domain-containing protein [Neobacillus drentensis]|uniref:class I SAM-dependent methyltransferase n=1 Tax=Neobacillus drentensis TaxID=220684 RepID=UPI001F31FBD3|nr:methyltransferase domain-containing protein [Neobacillus drentensis]ULT54827.1 methyltransferase domain-containing protein [Neobacillus drentensis]